MTSPHLRIVMLIATVTLIGVDPSNAQTPADPRRERQQRELDTSRTIEASPGVDSPYALPMPEITLSTTKEGTEARAVIGRTGPSGSVRITFKTPIGKEDDAAAAPLSLTGLGNQASVDFAVVRKRMFKSPAGIDQLMLDFCDRHRVPNNKCSDQAFSGTARDEFLELGIYKTPTFVSAHVQFGGKAFEFVEKGKTTKIEEKALSIAGGAAYGFLFLKSQSAFAVSVDAARNYAASKDSTLLCLPLATDIIGTERCDTRIIGKPTASRTITGSLEYRKVFTDNQLNPAKPGEGGKPATPATIPFQSVPVVGLTIQARVAAAEGKETIWSLEAPVHFLQRKPEKGTLFSLNGGASAGWNSKAGFVARVFIGPAFGLIGRDFQ